MFYEWGLCRRLALLEMNIVDTVFIDRAISCNSFV